MEANKNKYTSSRLKQIFSTLPFAFWSLFCKRDKNLIVFAAMHCRTFSSNSKFLFLYYLKNKPEVNVKFVINDEALRTELTQTYGDHFIDTRTKDGRMTAIKAATWIVSWLDLPIGGLFLNFRRYVLHLGHGTPLKCIGMMEKDGKLIKKLYYKLNTTNISQSLASTEYLRPIIAKCMGISKKRVLVCGQPRVDALLEQATFPLAVNKNECNILYAPTWRHYANVELFPFSDFNLEQLQDFLNKNKIHLWIRFHPAFEESIPQEYFKCSNISLFSGKQYPEIMDYLNCFDGLITDYSSIYLDYLVLGRPMIFLPYDLKKYEKEIGLTMDYEENTPGAKPVSQVEFCRELEKIKTNPEDYIGAISKCNLKFNMNQNSLETLAEIIREKINL